MDLPADEASTDGHLFTLVHHAGGLAGHHSVLVVAPGLASSALHSGCRQQRQGEEKQLLNGQTELMHLNQAGFLLLIIYKEEPWG